MNRPDAAIRKKLLEVISSPAGVEIHGREDFVQILFDNPWIY